MNPLPPNTEMIRAYLLEVGDWFISCGIEYKVLDKRGGKIYYTNDHRMGENSRERILLIKKPPKIPNRLRELAKNAKINYSTVVYRMNQMGWDLQTALHTPLLYRPKKSHNILLTTPYT